VSDASAPALISAPTLLVDGRITGPGAAAIAGGRIVEVLDHVPAPGPHHLRLDRGLLTAGLVDLQVNGSFGVDVVGASVDQLRDLAGGLARAGVTAFAPTFITAPLDQLGRGVDGVADAKEQLAGLPVARILGAHLEGPFLSPLHAGAHDPALMRDPDAGALDVLLEDPRRAAAIALVTLAPERAHALEAVARLSGGGVLVSIGHTDATAAQTAAAADAGARMVTHLFNAQRRLDHHEPGPAGHALVDDRFTLGLVADGHHVHADALRLALAAAPGRVALVTDALAAAGMPSGTYTLGGTEVRVRRGDVARRTDGTIAGSTLTLDAAVRHVIALGTDPGLALDAASRVPADALGRADVGRLAVGAYADLVWWDDSYQPLAVWVAGIAATRSR
jgi:N-acetylglucosamine-6-phosphate deacetylase